MTASTARRRRSTIVAAVAAVTGLAVIVFATLVGAATLVDSRAGRDVSAGVGTDRLTLPATGTGLLGVVDDDGVLASAVVVVLHPDGAGGSLVVIPPTADSTFVRAGDVEPLRETLELDGPDGFLRAVESLTAITFDVAELVDRDRFAALFASAGEVRVEAPAVVPDPSPVPADGSATLTIEEVADGLTATLPALDHRLDPFRTSLWTAVGQHAGSGTGAAPTGDDDVEAGRPSPRRTEDLLASLFAGRVGVRPVRTVPAATDQNPRLVDAVVVDRAEVLLVFGQIAPARVAVPNPSLSFRIEVGFSEGQLAELGATNADVARDLISVLLFLQANVVSVDTAPGDAPARTVAFVADAESAEQVREGWAQVFGEIDVRVAEVAIVGVDATLVLGEPYLRLRAAELTAADTNDNDTTAAGGEAGTDDE